MLFAIDDVVDSLHRILCCAEAARVHELERHDLNLPIDTRNPNVVSAFGSDNAGAVSAMTVLVHRIGVVLQRVITMEILNRSQLTILVWLHTGGTYPDVGGQVRVSVINAAIEYGDDHFVSACCHCPGAHCANISSLGATVLSIICQCPLFRKPLILRTHRS